jgi:hypothetical protein
MCYEKRAAPPRDRANRRRAAKVSRETKQEQNPRAEWRFHLVKCIFTRRDSRETPGFGRATRLKLP